MTLQNLCRRAFLAGSAMTLAVLSGAVGVSAQENAQGNPIRIGLLAPLSGTGGPYGKEEENAAKAAADYINEAGGVLGRRLEIVVADDETSPTAGVAAARKLIDVDRVDAVIGIWSSAVALAVKPVALEKDVALLSVGSADEITQGENRASSGASRPTGRIGDALSRGWSRVTGAGTASLLVLQTPFTRSQVDPFIQQFKEKGGEILDVVYFNPNQPSYRTEVETVFGKEPDAVFVASYIPEFSAIVREVFRSGFESRIYTYSHAADSQGRFVQNVGKEAAEGVNHVQQVPVGRSEAYKLYLRLTGQPPETIVPFGANVFDQVVVLALAIEKAKSAEAPDSLSSSSRLRMAKGRTSAIRPKR